MNICVLYSRNQGDFATRMYAAGKLKGELRVIGRMSSTFGNIRDLKRIRDKIVITNAYHLPRVMLLDPTLKVISAEIILNIPARMGLLEPLKLYLTKIWLKLVRCFA